MFDTDPLSVTTFDNSSAKGGTVATNGDNTLNYTSAPSFFGADCGGDPTTQFLPFTNPGQIGAHILLDWNQERSIDVINVWDHGAGLIAPAGTGI